MKISKTRTYAAMTTNKTQIRDNSMKLYSYLLCIAGKERLNQYDKSCYYFDQTQLTAHLTNITVGYSTLNHAPATLISCGRFALCEICGFKCE